ncbi:MAG: amidase family protein, partial [Alphaproteobacteria bacterium]
MASEATDLTIDEARDALAAGETSAVELAQACLDAIEAAGALNVFSTVTADRALAMAAASDARRKTGETAGAMDGIPLAVKDLFCT